MQGTASTHATSAKTSVACEHKPTTTAQPYQVKTPGFPNENFRMTEDWAAYVDPISGEGVGLWVPWCRWGGGGVPCGHTPWGS